MHCGISIYNHLVTWLYDHLSMVLVLSMPVAVPVITSRRRHRPQYYNPRDLMKLKRIKKSVYVKKNTHLTGGVSQQMTNMRNNLAEG